MMRSYLHWIAWLSWHPFECSTNSVRNGSRYRDLIALDRVNSPFYGRLLFHCFVSSLYVICAHCLRFIVAQLAQIAPVSSAVLDENKFTLGRRFAGQQVSLLIV